MKRLFLILLTASLLFSCAADESEKQQSMELLQVSLAYASSLWQKIDPKSVYPDFTYKGLKPGCSSCPPTVEADGSVKSYNPDFSFFVKRGTSNNLVVFFNGGGTCWSITNCVYNHSYGEEVIASELALGLWSLGLISAQVQGQSIGGLLALSREDNPFKDWTIVYVPYCTGDMGTGAVDRTYPDTYGSGDAVTIRHRGAVNFQYVLKWLTDNITAPDRVFVTGSSAGSLNAFFNMPHIRSLYPASSMVYFGDSGTGISGVDNNGDSFFTIVEPMWNIELPQQVPAFTGKTISEFTMKQLYAEMFSHYSDVKFVMYTTKYDKTQAWFYDIQTDDHINFPDTWGTETRADPSAAVLNTWAGELLTLVDDIVDDPAPNFRYYIGAGYDHTLVYTSKMYTEDTGGVLFLDWLNSVLNDPSLPANYQCTECGGP